MSTATQNIERAKGAKVERRWLTAEVRALLKLYSGDLVLQVLLDEENERKAAMYDELLAALKPFAHLADVADVDFPRGYDVAYVNRDHMRAAQAAVKRAVESAPGKHI